MLARCIAVLLCCGAGLTAQADVPSCQKSTLTRTYARMLADDQALRGRYIEMLEREHAKVKVDLAEKRRVEQAIMASDEQTRPISTA